MTPNMTWSLHSNFSQSRDGHSSAVMLGSLHVMGGYFFPNTSEFFNPDDEFGWQKGQDLEYESRLGCAVKISPEVFLLVGGQNSLTTVVEFNVRSGTKSRRADLLQGRYWHSCVLIKNREKNFRGVLVAGGYTGQAVLFFAASCGYRQKRLNLT